MIRFILIATCAFVAGSSALVVRSKIAERSLGGGIAGYPSSIHPWIVALMHNRMNTSEFLCSGTLISETFVVTAAHCFVPKLQLNSTSLIPQDVVAIFGVSDNSNSSESNRYQLSPKKIFIHDDWNPWISKNDADISLLEFGKGKITFNDFVKPICLWESENKPGFLLHSVITTWGKDSTDKHGNVPKVIKVKEQESCCLDRKLLSDVLSNRTFCGGVDIDSCSIGPESCRGDNGGGYYIHDGEAYYLKGIESSSNFCTDFRLTTDTIYTNVPKFILWIKKIMGTTSPHSIAAPKKVVCIINVCTPNICVVDQNIESEDYFLGTEVDTNIEVIEMSNSNIKHLPRYIGERFPNLQMFSALECTLTVIRYFTFKNMKRLWFLFLRDNQIASVEADSFNDLVSVERLYLDRNLLETLDEKIFTPMVNLKELYLSGNRIITLSKATFDIPGGRLGDVYLWTNVCINKKYDTSNWEQLKPDVRDQCTAAMLKVSCRFKVKTCIVDQTIDSEDFVLSSSINTTVKLFNVNYNKGVKYLPRFIGLRFPNLRVFWAKGSGLVSVSDYCFQHMQNLRYLYLNNNVIGIIEDNAFKDLTGLKELWMQNNLIEIFDDSLFNLMSTLEIIHLENNRIIILSPTTFNVPNGKLQAVFLKGNVCINKNYAMNNWTKLELDLEAECFSECRHNMAGNSDLKRPLQNGE